MKTSFAQWIDNRHGLSVAVPLAVIAATGFCDIAVWTTHPGFLSIGDDRPMSAPPVCFALLLAEPFASPVVITITLAWILLNAVMHALLASMVVCNLLPGSWPGQGEAR